MKSVKNKTSSNFSANKYVNAMVKIKKINYLNLKQYDAKQNTFLDRRLKNVRVFTDISHGYATFIINKL